MYLHTQRREPRNRYKTMSNINSTSSTETFKVGDRVRLTTCFERYPFCFLEAGTVGTVVSTGSDVDGGDAPEALAVRWDETVPGLEEWDNEGIWSADDVSEGDLPALSLERI